MCGGVQENWNIPPHHVYHQYVSMFQHPYLHSSSNNLIKIHAGVNINHKASYMPVVFHAQFINQYVINHIYNN